jgi:hypothetical protein
MPPIKDTILLANLKAGVSESSYEIYKKCHAKLLKEIDYSKYGSKRKHINLRFLYENPDIVILAIRDIDGVRNGKEIGKIQNDRQASYINSINGIYYHNKDLVDSNKKYKGLQKKWQDYLLECNTIKNKENLSSLCNEKLKKSVIPYETILKGREENRKKYENPTDKRISLDGLPTAWYVHQKYLLLELITNIKPKRCEIRCIHIVSGDVKVIEYETVERIKGKDKGDKQVYKITEREIAIENANYIKIKENEPMKLVLNHYKTKNKYGKIVEEIPKYLEVIIRKSLKQFPRKCLFGSKDESESNNILPYYKQQNYTSIFKGMFETLFGVKNLTPSKYRHIWVSDSKNIDFNNMSNGELEKICNLMGTSVKTAREIYKKLDISKKDEDSDMEEDELDERIVREYVKE